MDEFDQGYQQAIRDIQRTYLGDRLDAFLETELSGQFKPYMFFNDYDNGQVIGIVDESFVYCGRQFNRGDAVAILADLTIVPIVPTLGA